MIDYLKSQNEFLEIQKNSLKSSKLVYNKRSLSQQQLGSHKCFEFDEIHDERTALENELRDLREEKEMWHSEKRRDMGALVALGEEIFAIKESDTEESNEEEEDYKSSIWNDESGKNNF